MKLWEQFVKEFNKYISFIIEDSLDFKMSDFSSAIFGPLLREN